MLEPLCESQTLQILYSPDWNETLIQEFLSFDGIHKSTGTRKDDVVDALSRAAERVLSELLNVPPPQKSEEELQYESDMQARAYMKAAHDRMFGDATPPQQFYTPPPLDDDPKAGGLTGTLSRFGLTRK